MTDISTTWVAQRVAAFDSSGIHRIGTPGDVASGVWLEREAAVDGVTISRMPVAFNHLTVDEAWLDCAGMRIDGLPMFDSPSATAIDGTLCESGGDGSIGYAAFPPNAASIKGQPLELLRRSSRHAALIVATRVSGDSLAPINAQYYNEPFGPPVLLVAGMHHAFLAGHAGKGTRIRFVSTHHRTASESFNLSAVAPAGDGTPPLAIVTPRTGWWESTAERAGGMVAWLAAVHAAGALRKSGQLKRSVHAYATCGHELGHLGLQTLTQQQAPLVKAATYWLHLGANLGGAGNPALMIRAKDPADAQRMHDLLAAEGYPA